MKPAGYACLSERYDLVCLKPWHTSYIGKRRHCVVTPTGVTEEFPASYDPGVGTLDHLVFALKYDGVELGLLKALFPVFDEQELVDALRDKPHSGYLRRVWFLYEWLTRAALPIPDMTTGNAVDLLDPDTYVTAPLFRSPRHRVLVNTLGISTYCPMVRRTPTIVQAGSKDLTHQAGEIVRLVDPTVLARATSYLYLKESRTSWDIERVPPSQDRMARFLSFLRRNQGPATTHQQIIAAHNAIVDPDAIETGYRRDQVYVSDGPRIDYIPPKPEDVADLMEGLLGAVDHNAHSQEVIARDIAAMNGGHGRGEVLRQEVILDPVIHAALVGFGFVYIHPFADGNGRMHRFLIQNVLARRQFAPPDFIIPVSPAILRDRSGYLATLDRTSQAIMPHVQFERDHRSGRVQVINDTADFYRFPDLTAQCEYLYAKIEDALAKDVHAELVYLQTYDRALLRARLVRALPVHQEQALVRLCFAEGRLSSDVRAQHFADLPATELDALENTVVQVIQDCPLPRAFLLAQALDQGG